MARRSFIPIGMWCAVLAGATPLRAQARFEAMSRDAVPVVPTLEIVTVRDNALGVCYTVFMMDAPPLVQNVVAVEPVPIDAAAVERDRRLSELSADLQGALVNAVPGTLGPDMLKYEWEGMKAQSQFEQVVRQTEMAHLDARLKQLVEQRRLAVAGPMSCTAQPASSRRDEDR